MPGFAGDIWIEESVAEVTVSVVLPDLAPSVAVIAADPGATEVVRPVEPAVLLTAATVVLDDCQVTNPVRS